MCVCVCVKIGPFGKYSNFQKSISRSQENNVFIVLAALSTRDATNPSLYKKIFPH